VSLIKTNKKIQKLTTEIIVSMQTNLKY